VTVSDSSPVKVGIIGAGKISGIYLENSRKFSTFDVVAIADVRVDGAEARAREFGVPEAMSVDDLLAHPEVEAIINLTPHRVHGPVGISVVEAGKAVYTEKPIVVLREEGQRLLDLAAAKNVRVGGAPDTFFGGAWQTARKAIDDGAIGRPFAAFANLHIRPIPRPADAPPPPSQSVDQPGYRSFYATENFEYGGGAIFDRGPYYLNALIHLLGPVVKVTGSATKAWDERDLGGEMRAVNVPTHVVGVLTFASGVVCNFTMSNDVLATGLPHIEIYGTEGSLRCIDPNEFTGDIQLRTLKDPEFRTLPIAFPYNGNSRGVGVADMAAAIRSGRPHRATGAMAYHVVDIITAIFDASATGQTVELASTCVQPAPLPAGLSDWEIDA
jgi:predicted dehydrogenase